MYDINLVRVIANQIASDNPDLYLGNTLMGGVENRPFNFYLANINGLEHYCKKAISSKHPLAEIHIHEDSFMGSNIVGGYYEFGNNYHIVINSSHNFCWRRFALVKELCSLYTNHYGRLSGKFVLQTDENYIESLQKSVDQRIELKSNVLEDGDLASDTFAILLATELMIPPTKRKFTSALFTRLGLGEITLNDVAQSLAMPEYILKKMLDLHIYHKSCEYYEHMKKFRVTN